jgi:hypothetical protein
MGGPIVLRGFSSGKIFLVSFHRSSGMRMIVLTYFFLLVKYLTDNQIKPTSYIPIYFWERLLVSFSILYILDCIEE